MFTPSRGGASYLYYTAQAQIDSNDKMTSLVPHGLTQARLSLTTHGPPPSIVATSCRKACETLGARKDGASPRQDGFGPVKEYKTEDRD